MSHPEADVGENAEFPSLQREIVGADAFSVGALSSWQQNLSLNSTVFQRSPRIAHCVTDCELIFMNCELGSTINY